MNSTIPDLQVARQVLTKIPGVADATVVSRLSDGPSNRSFRVEYRDETYVLRLDKPAAARLCLDRENERLISQRVAEAGLAPAYLYFDPDKGINLRRYLQGRSWSRADLDDPKKRDRLAKILRTLHHLEPIGAAYQPLAAANRYSKQLGTPESRRILSEMEQLAEQINAASSRQSICHNDLLCQNILESDHLMLIDWEYTGLGDPFFDLAIVVEHHQLEADAAAAFLESYLQHPPSPEEIAHLKLQCRFYEHLLKLWQQIHP